MSTPLGSPTNLIITLGVLLKMLGFFVVLYSYAEYVPNKVTQAEQSLTQRFNISISLPKVHSGTRMDTAKPIQMLGNAYQAIGTKLKSQIDLFSQNDVAHSDELVMTLPAAQVLALNGSPPHSDHFPQILADTLKTNQPPHYHYDLLIKGVGGDADTMMRAMGDFAQDIVATQFSQDDLAIGYAEGSAEPVVEFHVKAMANENHAY